MRSQRVGLALALGIFASVSAAQVPQRVPATVTKDSIVDVLTVQNQRDAPVTVYMEHGRFDRRLGIVPPMDVRTLPLPAWAVRGRASVRLFVHVEGEASDLSTQVLALHPPGRVGLIVPAQGRMASPVDTMTAVIAPEDLAEATLTVDNPRERPVTVFAHDGRFDVRLGQVAPKSRSTLRFPKSVVHRGSSVRVFLHPEGGPDLASETFRVQRGKHIGLRVPGN